MLRRSSSWQLPRRPTTKMTGYERADHRIRPEQIADLVRKLGGDPDVPLFGAEELRD